MNHCSFISKNWILSFGREHSAPSDGLRLSQVKLLDLTTTWESPHHFINHHFCHFLLFSIISPKVSDFCILLHCENVFFVFCKYILFVLGNGTFVHSICTLNGYQCTLKVYFCKCFWICRLWGQEVITVERWKLELGRCFFSREPKLKNEYPIFPDVFFQHFFLENPKFQLEVVPKEICSTKSGPVLGIYIYIDISFICNNYLYIWEAHKRVDEEFFPWGVLLSWKWLQAMESDMMTHQKRYLAISWSTII